MKHWILFLIILPFIVASDRITTDATDTDLYINSSSLECNLQLKAIRGNTIDVIYKL